MTQPKALFLADVLEDTGNNANAAAAAELRRLHAQRDALLEALRDATKTIEHLGYPLAAIQRARAAIAKCEENICTSNVGNAVRPGVLEPHQLVNARRKKT